MIDNHFTWYLDLITSEVIACDEITACYFLVMASSLISLAVIKYI